MFIDAQERHESFQEFVAGNGGRNPLFKNAWSNSYGTLDTLGQKANLRRKIGLQRQLPQTGEAGFPITDDLLEVPEDDQIDLFEKTYEEVDEQVAIYLYSALIF